MEISSSLFSISFKRTNIYTIFLSLSWTVSIFSQDSPPLLSEQLQPLEKFIGKTWRGEFVTSTPEKPIIDISRWERALNGQAIRILHSINNGEYGGETLIVWDSEKAKLVFYYFTTARFFTQGSIEISDGEMSSHEFVTGNENGITEVKAVATILGDGRLHSKSQYLQNGKWVDGHEIFYSEDPTSEVIFK